MKVSAIVVTRGDVDCDQIVCSFPPEWEVLLWDNSGKLSIWHDKDTLEEMLVSDFSVYGRYAAIEHATGDVVYFQDDDVIVSDPGAIVEAWVVSTWARSDHVVCNMPQEFRGEFYQHHALVGFGAACHRDAPERAFERFWNRASDLDILTSDTLRAGVGFQRTCDIVFTGLTPRVLVDVPKVNMPYAYADNRMWKQPDHQPERSKTLNLVRQVANGG